jgi:DNA-binding winged helix-turn-helix (wHTH) protein
VLPGTIYAFGPFALDVPQRRLMRDGEPVPISDRHVSVLAHLLAHAGTVVSKDALVTAAWGDVAVTDNSVEQAISTLRRAIGNASDGTPFIETMARRGYRFATSVTKSASRESDSALEALLAPHRAWLEGRAALETLNRDAITHARAAFEQVLDSLPDMASAHVGMANACAMQFEMTRVGPSPDTFSLRLAAHHAQEACRLDPSMGEAWATLGFVLARVGRLDDALAASRRAIVLEPDNWRHHLRLSSMAWGEERLREAKRALSLLPGLPLAHLLAATVHVGRNARQDAERELRAGIVGDSESDTRERFGAVALHWLLGLILLARDEDAAALVEFERELELESRGHLYARECCANTWYAIGAMRLRQERPKEAKEAFEACLLRAPMHVMARAGLAEVDEDWSRPESSQEATAGERVEMTVEVAMAEAVTLLRQGATSEAVKAIDVALASAPPGNAAWLLPLDPLIRTDTEPDAWAPLLARVRARAR